MLHNLFIKIVFLYFLVKHVAHSLSFVMIGSDDSFRWFKTIIAICVECSILSP